MGPDVKKTWIRVLEASQNWSVHCHLLLEAITRYNSFSPSKKGGYLLWSSEKKEVRIEIYLLVHFLSLFVIGSLLFRNSWNNIVVKK